MTEFSMRRFLNVYLNLLNYRNKNLLDRTSDNMREEREHLMKVVEEKTAALEELRSIQEAMSKKMKLREKRIKDLEDDRAKVRFNCYYHVSLICIKLYFYYNYFFFILSLIFSFTFFLNQFSCFFLLHFNLH